MPWQNLGKGSNLFCGVTCFTTGSSGSVGFSLSNITINAGGIHTADQLEMTGIGTVRLTGFDPTLAFWALKLFPLDSPLASVGVEFNIAALNRPVTVATVTNVAAPAHSPAPIAGAGLPGLILASG